jgi:signal transduction histidine kinase
MRRTSLFRRILWAQVAALACLLAAGIGLHIYSSYTGSASDYDYVMSPYSLALTTLLDYEKDPARIPAMIASIQKVDETSSPEVTGRAAGEYHAIYQVLDAQGRLLYRTPAAPEQPLTLEGPGYHKVLIPGGSLRVLVRTGSGGQFRVLVAESLRLRRRSSLAILGMRARFFLPILAPLLLFTWYTTRRTVRPLRQLAAEIGERPPTDLSPLDPELDLKEIRPLIAALNRHMDTVSGVLDSQRQFLSDAAHSLRTPLAVLGTQAHALVREPDAAAREGLLQQLQEGIARTAGVAKGLLEVARLDHPGRGVHLRDQDAAQLARERVAQLVPLALAKGSDLGVEAPERLSWPLDPVLFATALDNLLENALNHTPPGTRITARIGQEDGRLVCEVEDDGPGIPEDFRAAAFERFSRGPVTTAPGAGLGLAIVRSAVELLGGSVRLLTPAGKQGLCVRLEIPRGIAGLSLEA